MAYPKIPEYDKLAWSLKLYSQLKHEYGAKGVEAALAAAEKSMKAALRRIQSLRDDPALARREPNDLAGIRRLRPAGSRRLWRAFNEKEYLDRMEGALLARMAGCTLGAPVEGWAIEKMEAWARRIGDRFPPTDYWSAVPEPDRRRYGVSRCAEYTRGGMNGVPVDDDVVYTILGLLVVEEYGLDFTTADVGRAWVKYLPVACTAEEVALKNLKAGVSIGKVGEKDNPFCEWIGADIRADPWGYMAPGLPELAAEMAYRDAFLSHRRNGTYGEMYFAAAISAAFAVDDPVEALRIGLREIPRDCALAQAVRWALKIAPRIKNYRQARAAVDKKFPGMHAVHTINNACLTVWGLTIGGTDVTRVISETVAMGLDNDCTAATAGSIVGAVVGGRGVPRRWHRNYHDTVRSYLIGRKKFTITGLVKRFSLQAAVAHEE